MAPITVRPTQVDVEIADAIAAHTGPRTEQAAELITWGADEHVLCALAVGWWLYSRSGDSASSRREQPRPDDDARLIRSAPHPEEDVRPGEAGPVNGSGTLAWSTTFRKAARRFSVWPRCAYRRPGIGCERSSLPATQHAVGDRCRVGVDKNRAVGALDE